LKHLHLRYPEEIMIYHPEITVIKAIGSAR